jgi:CheY-like chemotaxis protein
MRRPLICVVDDSADNRVLITAVLERAGMRVVSAEDGRALDQRLAAGEMPDLFILDLSLPGESGQSIMRRLRADPRWSDRRMLACTAHAMVGDAQRGLAEGFDAYLTKPLDVTTLASIVAGFLTPNACGGSAP